MGSHDILNGHRRFGRRGFLRGTAAAALAGLATPALTGRAKADGVVLNFASYGGVLNDYMTKLFAVPFEKETGIRVNFGGKRFAGPRKAADDLRHGRAMGSHQPDRRRISGRGRGKHHRPLRLFHRRCEPYHTGVQGHARHQVRALPVRHGL